MVALLFNNGTYPIDNIASPDSTSGNYVNHLTVSNDLTTSTMRGAGLVTVAIQNSKSGLSNRLSLFRSSVQLTRSQDYAERVEFGSYAGADLPR